MSRHLKPLCPPTTSRSFAPGPAILLGNALVSRCTYLLGEHEPLVLVEDEEEVVDGGPPVVVPVLGAVVVEPEGGGGEKRPVMLPLTVPVVEAAVLEAAAAFRRGAQGS